MDFSNFLGIAWENIFIGLLGAAVVGFLTFLVGKVKDKILEHKFPIGGQYITKYEDIIDGKRVVQTAPAILKQHGNKIKGKTWFGDEKAWILEGTILNTGNLYGVYFSESPWDKGIGNFFLSIDSDTKMKGLWSGYDSVNDTITSGKYTFTPIMKKLNIVDFTKKDTSAILRISDNELGKDYFTVQDLDFFTNNNHTAFCKVAKYNNSIAGFAMSIILTYDELLKYLKLEPKDLPPFIVASDRICVIKTVAVNSKCQGMGVGYKLAQALLEECRKNGINDYASVAWKSSEGTNIKGILEAFNLSPYKEIPDYWTEDSIQEGFQCPVCGNPCHCSAVMYFGTD